MLVGCFTMNVYLKNIFKNMNYKSEINTYEKNVKERERERYRDDEITFTRVKHEV